MTRSSMQLDAREDTSHSVPGRSTPLASEILGIPFSCWRESELTRWIGRRIAEGRRRLTVGNLNLHALYLARKVPRMAEFLRQATIVHIDGMGVVAAARFLGIPIRAKHRITYVDWAVPLARAATAGDWRVFFLGSRPGVGEKARETLAEQVPGFSMGVHHGYFDARAGSADAEAVLARINRFEPDLLLVGMGMPRQESWTLDHLGRLNAGVTLMAGACMDYVAGTARTPPRWLGPLGLEWAFRLLCDPRRLARRYLVEPWALAPALLSEFLRRRR